METEIKIGSEVTIDDVFSTNCNIYTYSTQIFKQIKFRRGKIMMYECIKDCFEDGTEIQIYTKGMVYQIGVDACIIDDMFEARDWGHDRGEISPEFYMYFKTINND